MAVGIPPVGIEKIVAIGDTRTAENNGNAVVIAAITVLGGYMIGGIGFGDRVSSNRQLCKAVTAIRRRCRGPNHGSPAIPQRDGYAADAVLRISQVTILIHIEAHLPTDDAQQLDLVVLHLPGEGFFIISDAVLVEHIIGWPIATIDAVAETRIAVP